jgi:probable rRNA maturation factor
MTDIAETVIEDPRWQALDLAALAEAAAQASLAALGLPVSGFAIALLACDDARIATLNAEFRDKPVPTNVLSWPSEERASEYAGEMPLLPAAGTPEDPTELGDIAIAYDTCLSEAQGQAKPFGDHVLHLLVHGVLHLLGFDHIDDADAELMEATEVRILASLGVADPY